MYLDYLRGEGASNKIGGLLLPIPLNIRRRELRQLKILTEKGLGCIKEMGEGSAAKEMGYDT